MQLSTLDLVILFTFFGLALAVGVVTARRAGSSSEEFFGAGRSCPWWLIGFSMVATTFAADTPLLVTDIVRKDGVAGNWIWWSFLLTGMLTVYVFASLWRRADILTDLEFYELRYSGKPAAFLRGFRAIYLGLVFNVCIMAVVTLAAVKIGGVMLGLEPLETILLASLVTLAFSTLGGLRGVMLTDAVLFVLAMVGAIGAAVVALGHPDVGGMAGLLAREDLAPKLAMVPSVSDAGQDVLITLLAIPLLVQWWSTYYPGAEPGGGGYVAQRMLAARDERHAVGATLFFNIAHYALRPWPWIIVGLASLVVYPDLASLQAAFPDVPADKVADDLAYPAMLTFLPSGLRGIVVTSLAAAYMSTISTHLNWGSSYVIHDFWRRFVEPEASEKRLVLLGRVSTVVMLVLAATLALQLQSTLEGFQILLQIGAGTGLIFILRWFWWRVNAWTEISAMFTSLVVALVLQREDFAEWSAGLKLVSGVGVTTAVWLLVTLLTPADDEQTLRAFYRKIRPGGPGWARVTRAARADGEELEPAAGWGVPRGVRAMIVGCIAVWSMLFATGELLYGNYPKGLVLAAVAAYATWRSVRVVRPASS